jgi:heterodisulfide reductase subunit A-like polyferredoxin
MADGLWGTREMLSYFEGKTEGNIVRKSSSRRVKCAVHVACMGQREIHILVGNPEKGDHLKRQGLD